MSVLTLQQVQNLIAEIGITEEYFCCKTGLMPPLLKRNEAIRINSILNIFDALQIWFDSPKQAWSWFTERKISGFGDLTASEVVVQNPDEGVSAVQSYIDSKNLGGFE
jgi:hypothetical protein